VRSSVADVALEDMTGQWVTSFAYPHGSFHRLTRPLVIDSGYRTAHAVKNALSHTTDDPFAVARFAVTATTSREQVRARPRRARGPSRMAARAVAHARLPRRPEGARGGPSGELNTPSGNRSVAGDIA
jgi:hypothetical protein